MLADRYQCCSFALIWLLSLTILACCVVGFRWYCGETIELECTIEYLGLLKTNLSKLSNITKGATFIRFKGVRALAIDQSTIRHLAATVKKVEIVDSKPLQTIIIPSHFAIESLFVYKTQLKWIHFQANDAIFVLSIMFSNLQQIPPSVKNLKNLQQISLQHSSIQHLNLDLLHWCSMLNTVDLIFNQIHTITSTLHNGQQRRLYALFLHNNRLSVLNLEVLAPLGWFTHVDFSFNQIELLVGRFSSEQLTSVSFSFNRLKTVDFCQWERVASLTFVSFLSNELTTVPNCMNHLANLTSVSFVSNKLTGVSMDAFASMENLTSLFLSNNNIQLITFREDGYPLRLKELYLSDNKVECDNHTSGIPLCSLDIEFLPRSPKSDWSRNKNLLRKQLTIFT